MKRKLVYFLIAFIFVSSFYCKFDISKGCFEAHYARAETGQSDIEKDLEEQVQKQISNLDFEEIESCLGTLSQDARDLFKTTSFAEKLNYVISGKYADESQSFFSSVISIFWRELKKCLPLISVIISVSILGGMVSALKPMTSKGSIGNLIHFITYGVILTIIGTTLSVVIKLTSSTLSSINGVFSGIFPVLLTLLTALGGSVSVGIYQPAIGMLGGVFVSLISYVLLPMFVFSVVFSIVGNLSNNVKLDKFVSFLQGAFKWTMGLCFTTFLGFISIQGIVAGSVDGLSIRTAKYAIKSYVPIVGGYVSDGLSIIMASSALIKNAIGGVGLLILMFVVISPIINIALYMLSLKFIAGIIEPLGDSKTANFVSSVSKSLSLLIALLVAVSFMYLVLTGLIMCSANLV